MVDNFPVIQACSYNLFHCPYFTVEHGTTPASEREANPDSDFLKSLPKSLRSFEQVVGYAPNQAFIGNLSPKSLPERPWHSLPGAGSQRGAFGDIVEEKKLYALMKFSDVFNLVALEKGFSQEALQLLAQDDAFKGADFSKFKEGFESSALEQELSSGALPLKAGEILVGCVRSAHPSDINLSAHTMVENLSSKATAVFALRKLLLIHGIDPKGIDYIIETSEEACGDMNQRGGGNFAKAIGELCGLVNATGSDVRSFCAGPVHGLIQAASLIQAGTFRRVVVVAGGTTAKLAMNAKKHMEKGVPVLEDCMGSFAVLVEAGGTSGIRLRTDAVGYHKIGSGSSPQAVIQDLVALPLDKAGLKFTDIDCYAPELQNPEITESAGAGNVTLANLKMIAAMAVMRKEIEKDGLNAFIERHGFSGWAPTQGHIPSGMPALGWFVRWANEGALKRALIIGKGSLFLGRMTNLFDGVSMLVEAVGSSAKPHGVTAPLKETIAIQQEALRSAQKSGTEGIVRIGLTIPGSESGEEELLKGAREARTIDSGLEVVLFGEKHSDPKRSHAEMEEALATGGIHGAVTFHYPFPLGIATVGHTKAPGKGKDLFIATTTGAASPSRVEALVRNTVSGIAVAKTYGIPNPTVGFLNSDGAATALKTIRSLAENGYEANLLSSTRGDALLRGNDILAGTVDVLVCDSLTGNAIVKLLAAFSTGGSVEVTGSGYGPGVGGSAPAVGIISRATAAPVVANAILFMARMVRGCLSEVYGKELEKAEKAGLSSLLQDMRMKSAESTGTPTAGSGGGPAKKAVNREIEGIDVLEVEQAVRLLKEGNIYCEAGMGCTGPVILVSEEDKTKAVERLKEGKYL